ncbi:MAG: efflux RND transporter periplasmic adaptor subunit, partial [Limisphaerales bacterium]
DGTTYPHEGKLLFQDVTVDPSSGMVTLRAEFPNPDRVLLPGMFAVGTVREGIEPNTILIPQRAVVIDPTGAASVMVVNATNAVESRAVELGAAAGVDWVVQSGLKSGDRVIVDGLQKAHPGMTVNPTVVKAPEENSTAVAAGE